MFLLNWYKEYLEIKHEKAARLKELSFCDSCETLKLQLAIVNDERKLLISKLVETTKPEESKIDTSVLKPVMPNRMNWNLRRQALEQEDRAAARVLRENESKNQVAASGGQSAALTVTEIEKELGVE